MYLISNRHPSIICLVDIMRNGHSARGASQVWERLWLGGIADAEELAAGNPHRITTVVSLSEIRVESKRRGVNYLHLPVEDGEPVPSRKLDRILDAIAENIRWGTVLLHCASGMSRAPSFTAAWMASVGYKNLDAALAEIKRLRPFILPSEILVESIRRHLK
jgi:protein-tyrosine phosphatase